jgi:tetratricopeptide (TPR) repeat protein
VLLAAIAFRVVYLLQYKAQIPYFSFPIVDSSLYDTWAQRVAAGEGYGAKPFYMAPLYPYLLALVYKILGHKLFLVYVGQAALGVLNLFLVYMLGRRVFGHRSGLVAMCLLMLYAPLVFLESKLLTETLAVTLNLASILLVMRAVERPSASRFLASGIGLGLSVICRPAALITAVLVGVWLALPAIRRAHGVRPTCLVLLVVGIAAVILPVTVRNYVVGRDFALISTNAGIVFAQGNSATSSGLFASLPGFSANVQTEQEEGMRLASKVLGRSVKPSESSSYWLRYGLKFIREKPGGYAILLARKLVWSLHNGESACVYNVYLEKQMLPALRLLFVPFSVLIALGLYGVVLSSRRTGSADAQLLGLMILSIYLGLMLFSVSSRFRVPSSAPLAVFAGFGICRLMQIGRDRDLRGAAASAAWIVPVFLISLVPYPKAYITSEAPANLGAAYFTAGRMDKAVTQLERAVEMSPGFVYARMYLGRALAKQGDYVSAIDHYKRVLNEQSENADAHYYLAYALAEEGRAEEAIGHYRQVIRLAPEFADAHFNLASLYDSSKRYDDAIREYRAAIGVRHDHAEAHNNLAIYLYTVGRYAEAWEEVRLARRYGRNPHPEFIEALEARMPEPR